MICIECGYGNIECLFYKYKSEYIQLTVCPECGKVADKYIEYDNVILFIDILLLKVQAYRHLAFNVTESELLKDPSTLVNYEFTPESPITSIRAFLSRYKQILRLVLMIILFEVYLIWAYEEKNTHHSFIMTYILHQKVHNQYLYFITMLLTQQMVLNGLVILVFRWFGWGKQRNKMLNSRFQTGYYNLVLLVPVLVSSSIKLFPILMLIWPYDKTSVSSSLVDFVGFIILLESLKIVTCMDYGTILVILSVSTVGEVVLSKLILISVLDFFTTLEFGTLLHSEYSKFLFDLQQYKDIILLIRDNVYV